MKRPKDLEGFVLFPSVVYFQAVFTQGIMLPFLLPLPVGYQEHQTSVGAGAGFSHRGKGRHMCPARW